MRILVIPLDGSALALQAVPYAVRIAAQGDRQLVLIRAVAPTSRWSGSPPCPTKQAAVAELDALADRLRADGLSVEARVVEGDAVSEIVTAACPSACELIVMSSHGRGGVGRSIYGSVADGVVRQASVPVLIVPSIGPREWPPDATFPILVPLDGSPLAESALRPATELADTLNASLHLLRVVWPPHHAAYEYLIGDPDDSGLIPEATAYLEQVATRIGKVSRRVDVQAMIGLPPTAIPYVATKIGAGAIAMATHGRGGFSRAFLGSVATATLQRADVPVLVVNAVQTRAREQGAHRPVEDRTSVTPEASGERVESK
jgi:nucleotide-binding universal stress UspA family protein